MRFSFEKNLATIVNQKQTALQNQDSVSFYRACEAGGFSGDKDPILYNTGLQFTLANNEHTKLKTPLSKRKKEKKKLKFDYESFGREVQSGDYEPNNIFAKKSAKIRLLKKYGIHKLTIRKNEKALIEDAKPSRIGEVFNDRYERYLSNHKNY
ncbi:MAG: hypothetical protein KJ592_01655 [Nanoarchaeota archaeon]|nr:hypothetical protein [Nanoarchaeota archaeon]